MKKNKIVSFENCLVDKMLVEYEKNYFYKKNFLEKRYLQTGKVFKFI